MKTERIFIVEDFLNLQELTEIEALLSTKCHLSSMRSNDSFDDLVPVSVLPETERLPAFLEARLRKMILIKFGFSKSKLIRRYFNISDFNAITHRHVDLFGRSDIVSFVIAIRGRRDGDFTPLTFYDDFEAQDPMKTVELSNGLLVGFFGNVPHKGSCYPDGVTLVLNFVVAE